ncbi:MAG TPA: hypothetical protein VME46_22435, partial [Acidimicrobiales bacterium]|nr:hypothetical protein [Acidimicrobiales bacterium]
MSPTRGAGRDSPAWARLAKRLCLPLAIAAALLAAPLPNVVLAPPASAAPAPTAASVSLQPGDVPASWSAISSDIENITDPDDWGLDQAFRACTVLNSLLNQFDSGPDATESTVYGSPAQDVFGSPTTSAASVVFSASSRVEAQLAYSFLASPSFQQCWVKTFDYLNTEQGITLPVKPSTVAPLATPLWGDNSTGFLINTDYELGNTPPPIIGPVGVSVIQSGAFVVMLFTFAVDSTFPDAVRLKILSDIAGRLGAHRGSRPNGGPGRTAQSSAAECKSLASSDAVDHWLKNLKPYKKLDATLHKLPHFPLPDLDIDIPGPVEGKVEFDLALASPEVCYTAVTVLAGLLGSDVALTAKSPQGGPYEYNPDGLTWLPATVPASQAPKLHTKWQWADWGCTP